jgi:hypothetical protein
MSAHAVSKFTNIVITPYSIHIIFGSGAGAVGGAPLEYLTFEIGSELQSVDLSSFGEF